MAIASAAIAAAPISGSASRRVVAACLSPWGDAIPVNTLVQPYSIRLAVELEQRYDNSRLIAPLEQPYGPWMARITNEQPWDSCIVVKAALPQEYRSLLAFSSASFPYGNAPVQAQCAFPIHFTVSASLESEWNLRGKARSQCVMPWTSTTSVAMQALFRWDRLKRDPVAASSIQLWNLAEDRPVRPTGVAVRAFHFGELV
ncbi:MAG: hypothetical protein HQL59_06255 [Magnetococcales bacterium]|nr:hypothetical protein [Magnetococcales bacterium]